MKLGFITWETFVSSRGREGAAWKVNFVQFCLGGEKVQMLSVFKIIRDEWIGTSLRARAFKITRSPSVLIQLLLEEN